MKFGSRLYYTFFKPCDGCVNIQTNEKSGEVTIQMRLSRARARTGSVSGQSGGDESEDVAQLSL